MDSYKPGYYGDPYVMSKLSMPYGAYGQYEQDFYDGKISFEDFCKLCSEHNHGDGYSKNELRELGYNIED